jgi:hypothetical protein
MSRRSSCCASQLNFQLGGSGSVRSLDTAQHDLPSGSRADPSILNDDIDRSGDAASLDKRSPAKDQRGHR